MAREYYTIAHIRDTATLARELQRILDSISRRLNAISQDGDNISLGGKKFTDLAAGVNASDSLRRDQVFLLSSIASVILGTPDRLTVTDNGDETITLDVDESGLDHGLFLGLLDDDHVQYLLLAGRSGGQVAYGGADASDNLTLGSTSNGTKGQVILEDDVLLYKTNYLLTTCGGNCLTIQEQTSGDISHLRLMSHDGDGTDNVIMSIHGVGAPADTTNRERLLFGWSSADTDYHILVDHNGTGSARELHLGNIDYPYMISLNTSGTTQIGDQSSSTYLATETDGDSYWVGSGTGLPYGSMYGDNIAQTVTVSATDTYYEIGAGILGGSENLCTFQNSKEIKVSIAGKYLVTYSLAVNTASANQEVESEVMVNGTAQSNTSNHTNLITANKPMGLVGTGILTLAVDDLVSLSVSNHTSTANIVVDHVNLTLMQIGG